MEIIGITGIKGQGSLEVEVVAVWLLEVIGSAGQGSLASLKVEEGVMIYIVSGNISQGLWRLL